MKAITKSHVYVLFVGLFALGNGFINNEIYNWLELNVGRTVERSAKQRSGSLDRYHFGPFTDSITRIWSTAKVDLKCSPKNDDSSCSLFVNTNASALDEQFQNSETWLPSLSGKLSFLRFSSLNPFDRTFIGVKTTQSYSIRIDLFVIDWSLVTVFVTGLLIFFLADRLSRNALFYYSSGVSVGLFASILLTVYILHKFMPKKPFGIGFLFGGWSLCLWMLYNVSQNIGSILIDYQKYVAVYMVTVSLVSLAFLYRMGPPTNLRTLNLLQCLMQVIGLVLIYAGLHQITEVAVVGVASSLMAYYLRAPLWLSRRFKSVRWRFFPPRPRLLTEEEYNMQGAVETRKALADLREFCQSPQCSPWRLTSSLHDPRRFASFIEGDSHLSNQEVLDFDSAEFSDEEGPPANDGGANDFVSDDDSGDDVPRGIRYGTDRKGATSIPDRLNTSLQVQSNGSLHKRVVTANAANYSFNGTPFTQRYPSPSRTNGSFVAHSNSEIFRQFPATAPHT